MTILLGTCSWTDQSLIKSGRFYPPGVSTPEERLRYYAGIFPTVEVDTSYYAVPDPRTTVQWTERTPDDFTFHVKAFRLLTGHWADLKVLPSHLRDAAAPHANKNGRLYLKDLPAEAKDGLWSAFANALSPLRQEGRLGTVLFQLAPWVPPSKRVYEHIEECKARLPGYQLAIEFRNKAWFEHGLEEAMGFLRRHQLIYVVVDEPQGFPSSVPPVVDVTGLGAYVRFHGRNRETWEKRNARTSAERFDYWYPPQELAEWTPRLEFLEREAGNVTVLFNTNNQDQGPENARRMASVLTDAGLGDHIANRQRIMALPPSGP